jgi:hypothetical protein
MGEMFFSGDRFIRGINLNGLYFSNLDYTARNVMLFDVMQKRPQWITQVFAKLPITLDKTRYESNQPAGCHRG